MLRDKEIVETYAYLFGRDLVLKQQQLDFEEGFKWTRLVHREPGQMQWLKRYLLNKESGVKYNTMVP